MDERERAERFDRELDAWLSGVSSGGELPAAARRLARADFSGESRIRSSLRQRLILRRRVPFPRGFAAALIGWILRRPLRPVPFRFATAAAAALLLLIVVFPVRRLVRMTLQAPAESRPVPGPVAEAVEEPQSVSSPLVSPAEPGGLDASDIWRKPITAEDIFETKPVQGVPLGRGPVEGGSPFSDLPSQPIFSTARGREVARPGRVQTVWETGDATLALEQRATSLDELFRRGL